jgi:hypothetical protein
MRISLAIAGALVLGLAVTAAAQSAIGDLSATDASVKGAVSFSASGTQLLSGSSVTAGQSRASLRLVRGGTLEICPRTALSITGSGKSGELLLALGNGALETHYELGAVADSIVTPDFRILLAGPGKFHLAVSVDLRGDTCVRALAGNAASAIVYEQMGQGVYQVPAGGQVLFHDGTVQNPEMMVPPNCGCPAASAPRPEAAVKAADAPAPAPQPAPASAADNVTVLVDAPFVFRAEEPQAPPPPLVASLQARPLPATLVQVRPLPPAKTKAAKKKAESDQKVGQTQADAGAKPQHKSFFQRFREWLKGKPAENEPES